MAGDLSRYTTFPFELPVAVRDLREPVEVEPARSGEGGVDCHLCDRPDSDFLWVDEHWRLSLYSPGPVLGEVILSPRAHVESFARLPPERAAELGGLFGRVQRAIEDLGGIGRVHVNYWGDGGAHLHVWFIPRPYGALQLRGTFFGMWSVLLPDLPGEELRAAGQRIAQGLAAESGTAIASS